MRTFGKAELLGAKESPEATFIVIDLAGRGITARNELFLAEYKKCELAEPKIMMSIRAEKPGTFAIDLKTDKPAFFVTLDAGKINGVFSDNVLTLLPGEAKTIRFKPKPSGSKKLNLSALRKAVEINHLRGTYT